MCVLPSLQIASGEIGARISQRDGMVEFLDPPRVASFAQPSPAFLEELDARVRRDFLSLSACILPVLRTLLIDLCLSRS